MPSDDELIQRLRDGATVPDAAAALVQRGSAALPVLHAALGDSDPELRARASEILAQIADPKSVDTFVAALQDSDGRVRSDAAAGLAHIGDPRGIPALIATLDDYPDILHGGYSRSLYTLMRLGPPALPALEPLLRSPEVRRRWQGFTILEQIVRNMPGQKDQWERLRSELGSYAPDTPDEQRNEIADRWEAWIRRHAPAV
jgi:HEAT repeat protein